jgi:hypothetical protein
VYASNHDTLVILGLNRKLQVLKTYNLRDFLAFAPGTGVSRVIGSG